MLCAINLGQFESEIQYFLQLMNNKTLGARNGYFEAVPALQGARSPCGLQDALPTPNPSCSLIILPFGGVSPSASLLHC